MSRRNTTKSDLTRESQGGKGSSGAPEKLGPTQEAALDAILARCGWHEDGTYLRDPDVQVFSEVVARHGAYSDRLEKFFKESHQLKLFQPPPTPAGKPRKAVKTTATIVN